MIIEGNLLIGILIVVALAIGALVVYIRFAVKKEPSDAGLLFSRLLKIGEKDDLDEEEDAPLAQVGPPGTAARGDKPAAAEEPSEKVPLSSSLGGVLSGVLGRKSKEKIKEEVRAIDDQLNSVLQVTEEINVPGQPPQIPAGGLTLSDGLGMKELDLEMGALQGPLEIVSPEGIPPGPPAFDLAPVAPLNPEEPARADQKKPEASPKPAEAEATKPAIDFMADTKKGADDDLLADLESSTKQVEVIDLSIMKEYQDMPITCSEIESDLKGILDQISINAQGKKEIRL